LPASGHTKARHGGGQWLQELLRGSGLFQFALGEVIGVDATIGTAEAVVIDFVEADDNRVADAGGVDGGDRSDFVEPLGLRALDAHLVTAGDGHRCAEGGWLSVER